MSLKDLRKVRQMTQQRMAELLGIGQEGISPRAQNLPCPPDPAC
jgi:hypothetical protein